MLFSDGIFEIFEKYLWKEAEGGKPLTNHACSSCCPHCSDPVCTIRILNVHITMGIFLETLCFVWKILLWYLLSNRPVKYISNGITAGYLEKFVKSTLRLSNCQCPWLYWDEYM